MIEEDFKEIHLAEMQMGEQREKTASAEAEPGDVHSTCERQIENKINRKTFQNLIASTNLSPSLYPTAITE